MPPETCRCLQATESAEGLPQTHLKLAHEAPFVRCLSCADLTRAAEPIGIVSHDVHMLTRMTGLTGQVCFSEKLKMFSPRASPSWEVKAYTSKHMCIVWCYRQIQNSLLTRIVHPDIYAQAFVALHRRCLHRHILCMFSMCAVAQSAYTGVMWHTMHYPNPACSKLSAARPARVAKVLWHAFTTFLAV